MISLRITSLIFLALIRLCCGKRNIFEHVSSKYGEGVKKLLRRHLDLKRKLEKHKLDLEFLVKCKTYNVLPKFLRFKLYRNNLYSSNLYRSFQNKLLNNEISFKKRSISKLTDDFNNNQISLYDTLSTFDGISVRLFVSSDIKQYVSNVTDTHDRKLHNLGINNELKPYDPNNVVYNYSSICLPDRLKTLLAFGLDFCLPIYKLNFHQYFLKFEVMISQLSSLKCQNFNNFTKELQNISYRYLNR